MDTASNPSLLTLPVEILYHIMDYLDTSTVFLSLSNVCTYFRAISSSYNRYQLDFCSISKPDFHHICRLMEPENILSLTLSDDNKTPGQIRLFLSLFNMSQFTRLYSLSILGINDNDLNKILHSNITSTLLCLSINWRDANCPSSKTLSLLSSVLKRMNLRKLQLKTDSYTIEEMPWPVQNTLEHLTLMYMTQKQYCNILRNTPNLQTLILNHFSMHQIEENMSAFTSYEQLTSLTLNDSRMTMKGFTSILSLTPLLTYLKIICLPDSFDTIADGFYWEELIRTNLPLLHEFQFFFTNIYNVYYRSKDIETLISRFQTSFWLEEKQRFVTCDYISYLSQVMLYTVPLCVTDFTYECEAKKISYSNWTSTNTDSIITDNICTINLTLTKLMAGAATTKDIMSSSYLFRNVTNLTIDADQEWSTECIQHLSTILDLSSLRKIKVNPDFNYQCIRNTIDNINFLLELASNIDTLVLHPYSSYDGIVIMKDVYEIIPHRIKYLELTIKDIDDVKMIVDYFKQLWSLTLLASTDRSIPWSEFIKELTYRKIDFVYWESYYSLHIWFGQIKN